MSSTLATRLTAEEFFDFVQRPENANRWFEVVAGEVVEVPPPTKPHEFVCLNIGRLLGNYTFAIGRFYAVGNDSGVILQRNPDTVRGPDVAVYDDASSFADIHPKYGESAPLLAVEVLSPSDRMGKVTQKVRDYLRAGTQMVWVVDPEAKSVQIFRAAALPEVVWEQDDLTGQEVLPGFSCQVGDLFRLPKSAH